MPIVGVLCGCAALLCVTFGLMALLRPAGADPGKQVLRAVAPAQLAAGVMLAAGAAVALAGPPAAVVVVLVCVAGAVGTLAAGSWQGARYAARRAAAADCGSGGCGSCTRSCH